MSSMFIEDIMPLTTNQDDYLKYYIEESLPLFDKINTIIKKGNSSQRQALINNLISYVHDSLFTNLIQFIIEDIGTWEVESINLFPKSLYYIIINNTLDNELFNTIFKHIIINITTGADQTKTEYTIYFDKIIEYYRPTKTSYEIYNNIDITTNKEFPYKLNNNIFEFILSLGKFGQTPNNRRLCCYLSSSLCRLLNNNIQDENVQKMYQRLTRLFEDPENIIQLQMVRELQYLIPLFKEILFDNKDVIKSIIEYIKLDWDHVPPSLTIICLLNNILLIENQKNLIDILFEKIKVIITEKEYEINFKNDIMDCLVHCLYNNYKLIPKIVNQALDLGIIEFYMNKFSMEKVNIYIQNFDKIFFLMNNLDDSYTFYSENISELNNNTSNTNTCLTNLTNICTSNSNSNISNNILNTYSQTSEVKNHSNKKIIFEELFINMINKLYTNTEFSESSSSNLISLTKTESSENKIKDIHEENKRLLFKYLSDILKCIFLCPKNNKPLIDTVFDLFKKESIVNILNYYCNENNEHEKFDKKKKNKFYKLLLFFVKNNYKKYTNNINMNLNNSINNNNLITYYSKELVYENNIYNKLFLLILNNIFSQMPELQKSSNDNNNLLLLISNTLILLIPKLYKYYKNIVIVPHNNNNMNYIITNNTVKENNVDNRTFYLEKTYEEIFSKIISLIILNNGIGFFIKKEYVKILPYLILYSYNRDKYLEFTRKELINSDNFFTRKYSLVFIQTCFENFSFEFIKKIKIYDDIITLMKDKVNIISTGIIKIVYENIKKIISYSNDVFSDLCDELNEIYNINSQNFNHDMKNFDKEKNIVINKILNIKELYEANQNILLDELTEVKDNENKLSTIENDIFNFELNFHKQKNKKQENVENNKNTHEIITRSIFQRVSSTSTSFQALKNNINLLGISNNNIFNQNYHIPFNSRLVVKKNSLTDKTSNILKSLTSKNITSNKHILPKIKGKRKDSNFSCNNGVINNNNVNGNIYIIKTNNCQGNKVICNEKEKIVSKNKKLAPFSKNRTPSAKALKANSPNNNINCNCDEFCYKAKTNKKSVSNKNINLFMKQNNKTNAISLQKDYNNLLYLQGNSNKIYINAAEKINTSVTSSK